MRDMLQAAENTEFTEIKDFSVISVNSVA